MNLEDPLGRAEAMTRTAPLGFASGLLVALLEDLRSVRAHTDMRTQTHTALQISTLVAAGALVGGFFGLQEQFGDISDVLLLTPIPFFIIAAQYVEVSFQVYIAESYVNRKLRPAIFEALRALAAQDGPPTNPAQVPTELLMFEWFADHSRSSVTARLISIFKGLWSTVTPIAVFLGLFFYQKPPQHWAWWHALFFSFYVLNFLAFTGLTVFFVHRRRGLPPLTEQPKAG